MSSIAYFLPSCLYSERTHMWGIYIKTSCDSDKVWEEFTWDSMLAFRGKSSSLACLLQAWAPVRWRPALCVMSWPHPSRLLNLVLISTLSSRTADRFRLFPVFSRHPAYTHSVSLQWLGSSCPLCSWVPVYSYGILASPWKQAKLKVNSVEWGCPTKDAFHKERGLE